MRLDQKRAVLARNLSRVLVAITVGLVAITAVFFSERALPSSPNDHSSSLTGSPSVFSSNSSAKQSAAQYPLVWAPNSPAGAGCNQFSFCIEATLALSGHTAASNTTLTTTTIVQDNTTTIVGSTETTIIHGITTDFIRPLENDAFGFVATALVQDAETGQNVTTSSGQTFISDSCSVPPNGFATCYIGGSVPLGHSYKVTVYLTKEYLPCSLRPANAQVQCESQLLAPSQTITVTE